MKKSFGTKFIILTAFFLALAPRAFAAVIHIETGTSAPGVGDVVKVKLILDTEGANINAIGGTVVFPQDLLSIKRLTYSDSIINFWVDRPVVENGNINFSGIVPGGYMGTEGVVLEMEFQAKKNGRSEVFLKDIKTLLNDGNGTSVRTTSDVLLVAISTARSKEQRVVSEPKDTDPPEAFTPVIAHDPSLFNGKYFLVFATQDKGSGIDHYTVREGFYPAVLAESPYLLTDQKLDKKVMVTAIDKSGNKRTTVLLAEHGVPWYCDPVIIVILILIVVLCVFGAKRILWKKY